MDMRKALQMQYGIAPDDQPQPGMSRWEAMIRALGQDATNIDKGLTKLGSNSRELMYGNYLANTRPDLAVLSSDFTPEEIREAGEKKIANSATDLAAMSIGAGVAPVVGKTAMGMKNMYNPAQMTINVWQGGPSKYGADGASQSLKHMDSGEGAQAYGWGRYDAENKAVGQDYYNQFNDPEMQPLSFKDKRVDEMWNDGIKERWSDVTKKMSDEEVEAFTEVMGNLSQINLLDDVHYVVGNLSPAAKRMYYDVVEPDLIKPKTSAYLYKHDLPDADVERYLDLDAPLSGQSGMIAKIKAVANDPDTPFTGQVKRQIDEALQDFELGNTTGETVLNILGKDQAASEALAKAGIPGLKYYDGMSRATAKPWRSVWEENGKWHGAGDGINNKKFKSKAEADAWKDADRDAGKTRNFVTWDQDVLNRMKLLERNGEMADALK